MIDFRKREVWREDEKGETYRVIERSLTSLCMVDTSTLCQNMMDERAKSLLAIVVAFAFRVPPPNRQGMKPSMTIFGFLLQGVSKIIPTNCHRL